MIDRVGLLFFAVAALSPAVLLAQAASDYPGYPGFEIERLPSLEPADGPPAVETEVVVEVAELPWWKPWTGSVELGLNGTAGNQETFNMQLGAKGKRATDNVTHTLDLTYVEKSSGGVQTAQNALFDTRVEWLLRDGRWTYFIHSFSEYDQFKAFDLRVNADTGFGYYFIKTDPNQLIGRLGASTSREFGGANDEFLPELLAGLEWNYKVNDRNKLSAKIEYYPNVTEFSDFRLNARADWEVAVAPEWGLSLKLGAINRYDSTPGTAKPNDINYSMVLLWNF